MIKRQKKTDGRKSITPRSLQVMSNYHFQTQSERVYRNERTQRRMGEDFKDLDLT